MLMCILKTCRMSTPAISKVILITPLALPINQRPTQLKTSGAATRLLHRQCN